MTLAADMQAALASIMAEAGSVAVVIDGVTGTGLAPSVEDATEFGANGETGLTTGFVRVSAATFTKPAHGSTIIVDGNQCVVMDTIQTAGVIRIRYRRARAVEGL